MAVVLLLAAVSQGYADAERARDTAVHEALPVTTFERLEAGQPQTVLLYGTSLTDWGSWTDTMKAYFEETYPGQITFVNAAKAGKDSTWGVANLEERVLSRQPDLVLLEFSVNDAAADRDVSPEMSEANLDRMVQALSARNPEIDIVLQTMNPVWDSPEGRTYASRPELEAYYAVYRDYARARDLPLVDHYPTWLRLQQESPDQFEQAIPDGIHPDSASSGTITWPAIEALLETARAAAASR